MFFYTRTKHCSFKEIFKRKNKWTKKCADKKIRTNKLATKNRAGEMIPEVEGTRPWGPEEKGPEVSQRTQNHLYLQLLQLLKNTPREVKRAHFVIYWVPLVPPRKWNLWCPEGKVPPGPPRFLRPWRKTARRKMPDGKLRYENLQTKKCLIKIRRTKISANTNISTTWFFIYFPSEWNHCGHNTWGRYLSKNNKRNRTPEYLWLAIGESRTGLKFEQLTFKCNFCLDSTHEIR